ncbi:hypothetical protein BJV78DRAFT_1285715 [Lactifluus subvellereus]|nr:hypothetical protein BJV78DRAFT_1285715 [Lactifluus subvellereus]
MPRLLSEQVYGVVIFSDFVAACILLARENIQGSTISPTDTDFLSLNDDSASTSSPPYSVPKVEAMFYYSGLCSSPRLVYRTSAETTPWTMPTGPEAYRQLKELRPVFGHKLNAVWTTDLGPKVCQLLDSKGILWTSIDVVRFIKVRKGETVGPVVLWIGVAAESLSGEDAHTSANGCLDLLKEFDITDVEVEFRESIYTPLAGPNLLKPASYLDPDVDVRGPLTPALGLSIASQATPRAEGTGGIYLAEGGDSKKVLLVTARHVLFPPDDGPDVNYACTNTSAPRRNVLLLGTKAFNNFLDSIKIRIARHAIMMEGHDHEWEIEDLQARVAGADEDAEKARKQLERAQRLLDDTREAMQALEKFYYESKKKWSHPSRRILGHIVRSPPITPGAGTERFTEDYAVVELDSSKIKDTFKGNVIDLGTKIPKDEFTLKIRDDAAPSFKYPHGRLLPLRGLISEDLMRSPDMLDHDGESCLLVIKNGNATGVTIGRATGIFSYVRKYFSNHTHQTSMEWAILPYDSKSGAFSAPGDSGSIIVDVSGRVGGILTGGAGKTASSDITYATPFFWLLPRIRKTGFLTPTSTRSWTRRRGID